MSDNMLQRLLDAEMRAQQIIDAASHERQRIIDAAFQASRDADARFVANRAALREPYLHEANTRAQQHLIELKRRYAERQKTLRDLAARHETEAVQAGLQFVLDSTD